MESLEAFLTARLGSEQFEMTLNIDPDAKSFLGFSPTGRCPRFVAVDECQVFVGDIIASDGSAGEGLEQWFLQGFASLGIGGDTCHVAQLLLLLYTDILMHWLFKQVVAEVFYAIEVCVDFIEFSTNPIDGASLLGGTMWDPRLTDHLVLGFGTSAITGSATFSTQHTRSFFSLCRGRVWGRKQFSTARAQGSVLSRYLHTGMAHFESATDLCLSLDGSRVGGREFLLVFLVGRASDGRWAAMWGPPQVVPRHPWSQRHRSPIFAGEAPFRDPQIASRRKLSEDSQNRVFTESLGTSGKCAILRTFSELQFRPSEFSEPGAAAFLGIGPSPSSYGGQT